MMNNENRKSEIQNMITKRLNENDTVNCLFQMLLLKKESKSIIEALLKRNGCQTYTVDTVEGCWNLNDEWYELNDVEAIVEYCGVYPIKWDIDDVVLLEKLYYNREIYIKVLWKKENKDRTVKYIPNH